MLRPAATRTFGSRSEGRGLLRFATAALGCVLLLLGVLTAATDTRAAARDQLDSELGSRAQVLSVLLGEYFERARTIDLLLARDPSFHDLLASPDSPHHGAHAPARHAGAALTYLESLYPGRISEACLIAADGQELSRVTRGVEAEPSDLSPDESENPFFQPTTQLSAGQVYQSSPYLSPDTEEWVISNSTPVFSDAGELTGIVHFEVLLDSFVPHELAGAEDPRSGADSLIVDATTGRVVLDENGVVPPGASSGVVAPRLRSLLAAAPSLLTTGLDGERAGIARVDAGPHNANAWFVVVKAPVVAHHWTSGVSLSSMLIVLAALMLFAFAAFQLRATHLRLKEASITDDLTGLPNRRLLGDRLEQALLQAKRRGTSCGVMLIDLDRFKDVNDTLGHHHGDQLLRAVAERLQDSLRRSDTVARLGGDEFAVLMPEVADEAAASVLAERCLASLHDPFTVEGVALTVEASVGVALAPQHGATGHALMRAADVAMYEAKAGRVDILVYDARSDLHTPHRLALLGDLRHALQGDEIVMHYQPKIRLDGTGEVSVEALVRWHHPTRGLLAPDEFIPVVEATGLMTALTLRTIEVAAAQAARWAGAGRPLQVAVNLSPRCLTRAEFPDEVRSIIEDHGLQPSLLRMEVTESSVMADPPCVLAVLAGLREMGVALSVDDFGTGYSSMAYLKRLPVDELKIDRTFVKDMLVGNQDDILVQSSIDLAHNLGLTVVAEGVEDEATLVKLAALGCDAAQGYHLGRPMPPELLEEWLADRLARVAG